ncbi:MAG TPA: PAS domain-containing protein, partial [Methylomirabilota bacterium]|nr:PAS domain-containing protein [Methylomirabilota bacterium]
MDVIQQYVNSNLAKTLDHALEGFQIISFDWRYLYVNETVAKQGRQTKEKLLGNTMMEIYPGIEKTPVFSQISRCMQERVFCSMENEFNFPDGKKEWFELHMEPVPEGVLIFSINITERKKTQTKLQEANIKNGNILASIGEGLLVTNQNGSIVMLNRAAQEMLGYTTEELLDKSITTVLPMVDEEEKTIVEKDRPISLVLATKKTITNTKNYYIRKNREKFPVAVTITPILSQEKLTGTIEVFRDITKEKAIDKAKTEFVSIASHALRTPLGISK